MDILIKVAQLFLSFTILVGIHECGHFFMAKLFKIKVEKFYIFFDPWFSLFKWKRGETEYGIGWLPLGGYIKIAGMIDESMDKEQMAQPVKEDDFRAKPAWQRLLVMIAGVVMNLVLAVVIYIGVSYTWGDSYFPNEEARWGYNFNEAGETLGFRDGDKIISIDGEAIDNIADIVPALLLVDGDRVVEVERNGASIDINLPLQSLIDMRNSKGHIGLLTPVMPFVIDSLASETSREVLLSGDQIVGVDSTSIIDFNEYKDILAQHKGESVDLMIKRADSTFTASVPVSAEGTLGVTVQYPFTLKNTNYTLWEAIPAGFTKAGDMISSYWGQLKLMVKPETELYKEVGGFISIGSVFSPEWNWLDFWLKTALLSVMLAILNILPIPGLDGGHTLFTLWEIITRRKPSEKFLEVAQTIGMILLFALLIFANGSDIVRLFK